MQIFTYILLGFLVVCAVSVSLSKNLLNSILIYMSYSLVMSIIWLLLESPDLAITEAAVGAGVTSLLFFVTLKKIQAIVKSDEKSDENLSGQSNEDAGEKSCEERDGKPDENSDKEFEGDSAEGPDEESDGNSGEWPDGKEESDEQETFQTGI